MSERIWEIRWHGRGGQGTVTAANLLAKAALYSGFRGTQAFPFFGAERRGAPVRAFTRISKTPILVHSQVYNPDAIIVLDSTLMRIGNVLEGAKENAFLLVNSTEGETQTGTDGHFNTYVVDATGIALELGLVVAGQPVASTPMLGAFSRATKLVSMESISRAILEEWGGEVGQKNVRAAEEAYDRSSISRKEQVAKREGQKVPLLRNSIKETREHLTEYAKPSKGAGGKTGLWRTFRPTIISDKCKKCMLCWQFCPEGAISKGKDGYPEIDYTYCKGCGICAHECKPKAIKMKREGG